MKWEDWIDQVQRLCGDKETFNYYNEWYSFITAFHEKNTPKEAYQDCHEWMNS